RAARRELRCQAVLQTEDTVDRSPELRLVASRPAGRGLVVPIDDETRPRVLDQRPAPQHTAPLLFAAAEKRQTGIGASRSPRPPPGMDVGDVAVDVRDVEVETRL